MEAVMMTTASMNEAVAVSSPVVSFAELNSAVDELVQLQRRAAESERRAKVLRGEIREGMARAGLRKFSSSSGHTATVVESTSFRGDKEAADGLLDPAVVALIFRPTSSTTLRVK
jgi:hypothetical protein